MQSIHWKMLEDQATLNEIYMGAQYSNALHWFELKIGYQDYSTSDDHQGDMP